MDTSFQMFVHILVGFAIVGSGAMALISRKGSAQHKLCGRIFVGMMLLMAPFVVLSGLLSPANVSPLGILFVFFITYLVLSAWPNNYRPNHALSWLDFTAPMVALCISITGFVMGFEVASNPIGNEGLPPTAAYFFFACLAFMAMLLDFNNVIRTKVRGKHRLIRHVWRMNGALFFSVSSLFTGPGAIVFPESVRESPALLVPQCLVVLLTALWIYRLLNLEKQHSLIF